jgi:hypothetical protein
MDARKVQPDSDGAVPFVQTSIDFEHLFPHMPLPHLGLLPFSIVFLPEHFFFILFIFNFIWIVRTTHIALFFNSYYR